MLSMLNDVDGVLNGSIRQIGGDLPSGSFFFFFNLI